MLHFMRPLVAPFLDRVEGRVRRSLETSGLARLEGRLQAIEVDQAGRLERLEVASRSMQERLGHMPEQFQERLGGRLQVIEVDQAGRLDRLEIASRYVQEQLDITARLLTLIEARVAEAQTVLGRHDAMFADLRASLDAVGKMAGTQDKLALWLAPLEARLLDLQDRLQRLEAATGATRSASEGRWSRLERAVSHIEAGSGALGERLAVVEDRSLHLLTRQIVQLSDGFSAVHTPQGWIVVPEEDHALLIHLAHGRAYHEPGTSRVVAALLRPGDTAIDAGAHIGLLTLPMARGVGDSGRVVAVEPMARSVEALRRAATLNLLPQIELRRVAVADAPGRVELFTGANSMMASLFPRGDDATGVEVERARLDDLVVGDDPVSLAKLDVEGAEFLALAGMQGILDRSPEIVVIAEFGPAYIERAGIGVEEWLGAFRDRGLTEIYRIDEQEQVCRKSRPTGEPGPSPSVNLLFSRPGNPRLVLLPVP